MKIEERRSAWRDRGKRRKASLTIVGFRNEYLTCDVLNGCADYVARMGEMRCIK